MDIMPEWPGFESWLSEVGDIAKCPQKTFFSILNFVGASECDLLL